METAHEKFQARVKASVTRDIKWVVAQQLTIRTASLHVLPSVWRQQHLHPRPLLHVMCRRMLLNSKAYVKHYSRPPTISTVQLKALSQPKPNLMHVETALAR
jgi:hypothetical protein